MLTHRYRRQQVMELLEHVVGQLLVGFVHRKNLVTDSSHVVRVPRHRQPDAPKGQPFLIIENVVACRSDEGIQKGDFLSLHTNARADGHQNPWVEAIICWMRRNRAHAWLTNVMSSQDKRTAIAIRPTWTSRTHRIPPDFEPPRLRGVVVIHKSWCRQRVSSLCRSRSRT